MPNTIPDQQIRLLHLSDLHFTAGQSWDADPVLRALAQFIGKEARMGLTPDLVIITGDLAFAGKAEEYQLAQSWLEQELWPALKVDLPRDRLLLVPGNHDVDRSQVGQGVRHIQNGLLKAQTQEEIASLMKDENERQFLLKRHAAYLEFYRGWLSESQTLPWWQRSIEIRGQRLHVAGLDSAWMACGDEDRGQLLLSRWQINQTVVTRKAEEANWRIALLHHPWDYLAELDIHESRQTIHLHRDLLLRGHLHQPQSERVVPPDPTRTCLELAAGCVYENSRYPNAYQWIELYPRPRRVKVLFRAWIQGVWAIDRNQPGCPNGEAQFNLGQEPKHSDGPKEEGTATRTAGEVHKTAVVAITKILEFLPTLCASLAAQARLQASSPAELAAWLCDSKQPDFVISTLRLSISDALLSLRRKGGDPDDLCRQVRNILGWMVVISVMDDYSREDCQRVRSWFDGKSFQFPLSTRHCVEILTACWRGGQAEFSLEKGRIGRGQDDITPDNWQERGFDDPANPDTKHPLVNDIWRIVYQRLYADTAPPTLSKAERNLVYAMLDNLARYDRRHLRFEYDRRDPKQLFHSPAAIEAIYADLPQIYLISTDSDQDPNTDVFVLPEARLAAAIHQLLRTLEKCS